MRLLQYAVQYDLVTFGWFQRVQIQQRLVPIAKKISWTADGYFYSFLVLFSLLSKNFPLFKVSLIALSIERVIYFFLKKFTRRNRPPEAIPGFESIIKASDQFSFPSGHTSAAFLLATITLFYFPLIGLLLLPWACTVGCARVILGVHFPTDTLAGAALGSSIALLSFNLML